MACRRRRGTYGQRAASTRYSALSGLRESTVGSPWLRTWGMVGGPNHACACLLLLLSRHSRPHTLTRLTSTSALALLCSGFPQHCGMPAQAALPRDRARPPLERDLRPSPHPSSRETARHNHQQRRRLHRRRQHRKGGSRCRQSRAGHGDEVRDAHHTRSHACGHQPRPRDCEASRKGLPEPPRRPKVEERPLQRTCSPGPSYHLPCLAIDPPVSLELAATPLCAPRIIASAPRRCKLAPHPATRLLHPPA